MIYKMKAGIDEPDTDLPAWWAWVVDNVVHLEK